MIIIIYYNASYTTNFSNFSEICHLSLFLMYNVHTIFCLTFLQRIMLVVLCSFSIIDVIYCTLFVRIWTSQFRMHTLIYCVDSPDQLSCLNIRMSDCLIVPLTFVYGFIPTFLLSPIRFVEIFVKNPIKNTYSKHKTDS